MFNNKHAPCSTLDRQFRLVHPLWECQEQCSHFLEQLWPAPTLFLTALGCNCSQNRPASRRLLSVLVLPDASSRRRTPPRRRQRVRGPARRRSRREPRPLASTDRPTSENCGARHVCGDSQSLLRHPSEAANGCHCLVPKNVPGSPERVRTLCRGTCSNGSL